MLVYGLSDNTIRFKPLKEDDLNAEYDLMQMKTWIFSLEVLQLDEESMEMDYNKAKLQRNESTKLKRADQLIEIDTEKVKVDSFIYIF